jgi:hypothetical protein
VCPNQICACKVFDTIAAWRIYLNFSEIFGGVGLNIIWSRMVVVVCKMGLFCENPKWVWSSLCFKVATCHLYIEHCRQSQLWWSTQELFILVWCWMRWKEVRRFSLTISKTRGSKWVTFYYGPKWPLSYVVAKVFVIDLLMFPKHWHKPKWSWLRICKVGHKCMWVRFVFFQIFDFPPFEVLWSCTRV